MTEFNSNKGEFDRKFEKAVKNALRLVGGQAERMAKETISDMKAVDTGFLRNSITFALAGENANVSMYASEKGEKEGEYEGEAPDDDKDEYSVYIGTNVYYAPYVEYGTIKMPARPFMSTSIQQGKDEFKRIFEKAFSNFM